MDFEPELRRLGYSKKWIESGILSFDVLREQAWQSANRIGSNFEHERLSVLRKWISIPEPKSDDQIEALLEIAQMDSDKAMISSALVEMLDYGNLTDPQFDRIAAALSQFGDWTLKRIERAKLKRGDGTDALDDLQFEKCLSLKDSVIYKWLFEHPKISYGQMKRLSEAASSKAIRNMAKESLSIRRWDGDKSG